MNKKKGSALVFGLVIMSIMLVTALAISISSSNERKASLSTAKSVRAFQIADSGSEIIMRRIYYGGGTTISNLGGTCTGGKVTGYLDAGEEKYEVTFFDIDGDLLDSCSSNISDIAGLHSVGTYSGTVRAVEMGVRGP